VLDSLPEEPFRAFCRFEVVGKGTIIVSPPPPTRGYVVPFNIHIARFVLANVMGIPEKEDWKKCILDEKTELGFVEEMRGLLSFE
jgi:hypothetical protein